MAVGYARLRFTTETADPVVPSAHESVSRCHCQLLRDHARRPQLRGHGERQPCGRWRGRTVLQLHPFQAGGGAGVGDHHGPGDTHPVSVHWSDQPKLPYGLLVPPRIVGSAGMRFQRRAEQRAGPCPVQTRDDIYHHRQGLRLGVHDSRLNLHNARASRDHAVAVRRRERAGPKPQPSGKPYSERITKWPVRSRYAMPQGNPGFGVPWRHSRDR